MKHAQNLLKVVQSGRISVSSCPAMSQKCLWNKTMVTMSPTPHEHLPSRQTFPLRGVRCLDNGRAKVFWVCQWQFIQSLEATKQHFCKQNQARPTINNFINTASESSRRNHCDTERESSTTRDKEE